MSDTDEISAEAHAALAEVFRKTDDSVMVKYLAVAEVIEQNGERGLWCISSPDMKKWETLGFLEYATHLELADTVTQHQGHA